MSERDSRPYPDPADGDGDAGSPSGRYTVTELRARAGVTERPRSRRRSRSAFKVRVYRTALAVLLGLLLMAAVMAAIYFGALRAQIESLEAQAIAQERELSALQGDLAQAIAERDEIIAGRNPGLRPLDPDRAIPIDHGYVRNIIFTETGVGRERRIEYRMVMHNADKGPVLPAVTVMLFDAVGVQIGMSDVLLHDERPDDGPDAWLQPGETRSYTAIVPRFRDEEPRFFQVALE